MDGWTTIALIIFGSIALLALIALFITYTLVRLWKKRARVTGEERNKRTLQFFMLLVIFIVSYATLVWTIPVSGIRHDAQAFKRGSKEHAVYLFNITGFKRNRPFEQAGGFRQFYSIDSSYPPDSYNQIDIEQRIYRGENLLEACQSLVIKNPTTVCEKIDVSGVQIVTKTDATSITSTFALTDAYIQLQATSSIEWPYKNYKLGAAFLERLIDSAYIYKPTLIQRVLAL